MPESERINSLGLSSEELKNIEEYRKKKNTAVLTIMFTDIQGFTQLTEEKGETYVHKLHQEHDKILVSAIEENNTGVVIKYIGDAIMAVFAEPTSAVEKSLQIQRDLEEFNKNHPELDDLKVRIGLHMGQTVIENKMKTDLFGRHVNRASRVESLAAGGHVYVSYTVFDSVKSWLMDHDAEYKYHGDYLLKGIKKPEEIYEVYNPAITKPQAPKKGKKAGFNYKPVIIAAAAVVLATLITVSLILAVPRLRFNAERDMARTDQSEQNETLGKEAEKEINNSSPESQPTDGEVSDSKTEDSDSKTDAAKPTETPKKQTASAPAPAAPQKVEEVLFMGLAAEKPILDFQTPLAVATVEGSNDVKKPLNDIAPGKHTISYMVSRMVWYFSEFEVKPGKNIIDLKFTRSEIPTVSLYTLQGSKDVNTNNRTNSKKYIVYDKNTLTRIEKEGEVFAESTISTIDEETVKMEVTYSIKIDNQVVTADHFDMESKIGGEKVYVGPVVLWEDENHKYYMRYNYINNSLNFFIDAEFK